MHDLPRQKLSELLAKHGHSLCDDPKRLEGLLKDMLRNEYKRETFVLISTLREGVVDELHKSTTGMPAAALAAKLARQLCDNLGLDQGVAVWSVESWAAALSIKIMQPLAAPIRPVVLASAKGTTPSPAAGVDLAALALQHREKERQNWKVAAEAAAFAEQLQTEAKILAARSENDAKAKAASVQKQAKELAEHTRDFVTAATMLEEIEPQWRNAKLYEEICRYRDRVTHLDAGIQNEVRKGRLWGLRRRVKELLKLQPKRDDMRRLLEVLPDEKEMAREFTNSIGMKFVLIHPGEFTMGSSDSLGESPPHRVEITQPFYLGVYPVTQAEYQAVIGKNPSHFNGNSRLPVEQVSWYDADAFCKQLSQSPVEVQRGMKYRLPTEAEWEYACRAGTPGKWCFGDNESLLSEYAWFDKNSGSQSHPVGQKKANNSGLYDMHGNVWEWCQDGYDANAYQGRSGITQDPFVATGPLSVNRGGSWFDSGKSCRSANRDSNAASFSSRILGFRIALNLFGLGSTIKNHHQQSNKY
jgi:formylglycine-generating enzyme required for sulfatase activity